MKKVFTLKNIILLVAALIGVVMFAVSFAIKVDIAAPGGTGAFKGLIWGCTKAELNGEEGPVIYLLGLQKLSANLFGLLGVILVLVAAVVLCLAVFLIKNQKIAKILVLVAAGLLLIGGIFQLLILPSLKSSLYHGYVNAGADPADAKAESELIIQYCHLSAGSIVCGAFTFAAAVASAVAAFLPEKK